MSLLLASAGALKAQVGQQTANSSVSLTVPTVVFISASANFNFGQPAVAEFDAGEIGSSNTITLTHRSNVVHDVQIQASKDTMDYSGSEPPPSKPVTDLQISIDGGSTYTPVAKASTSTLTASEGLLIDNAARGSHSETASARITLSYADDPPGTYGASFTFTIVAD